MKEFKNYILERLESDVIIEGLIINKENKTVSLTDKHNKGIDFSVFEPVIKEFVSDDNDIFTVYSIFKRTRLNEFRKRYDGNPFVYALKNIKGWKFDI